MSMLKIKSYIIFKMFISHLLKYYLHKYVGRCVITILNNYQLIDYQKINNQQVGYTIIMESIASMERIV